MKGRAKLATVEALTLAQVSASSVLYFLLDSFRRFVKTIGSVKNPEYGVDISAGIPYIADYGNIEI